MVARHAIRGQFNRVKGLIAEVTGNIICLCDELQSELNEGEIPFRETRDSMNAANILKPALSVNPGDRCNNI